MDEQTQASLDAIRRQIAEEDHRLRNLIGSHRVIFRTPNPGLPAGQSEYLLVVNEEDAVWFYVHTEEGCYTDAFIINNEAMIRLARQIVQMFSDRLIEPSA